MNVTNESDTFGIGGDLTVHRLGFGGMRLCGDGIIGEPDDPEQAREVARTAVDLGVDLVDTADSYGPGTSERLIREALSPYEDVVVATKGGLLRSPEGDWITCGDPDYLRNAALCSLDRLGVDTVDLYQYHRPDPDVPFEDSLRALADLRDDGYLRHVGLSNVDVEQLERAREVLPVATVQNRYNVTHRDDEAVLRACEEHGIGFVPWYPLAAGALDHPAIGAVAERRDATPAQVALAWLLAHSPVTLPIPGTSDPDHLAEDVAATSIDLTDEDLARLDDVDPVD